MENLEYDKLEKTIKLRKAVIVHQLDQILFLRIIKRDHHGDER